jgi:hypothetical protein
MTSSQLYQISGLSLVAGAVVFIVHLVARSVITAGVDPATLAQQGMWVPVNLLGVLGAVLVLCHQSVTMYHVADENDAPKRWRKRCTTLLAESMYQPV